MARVHPRVAPLRELRGALSELRLNDLAVGRDGRNRTLLSAFRARTARNQPSNSQVHLRPVDLDPGADQAAARATASPTSTGASRSSASPRRCRATRTCRPPTARAIPISSSPSRPAPCRRTPPRRRTRRERDQFKACALGVQYGLEAAGLAQRIGQPLARGRHLLRRTGTPTAVLGMVRQRRRSRHAARLPRYRVRLDDPRRRRRQPPLAAQLPDAGQRRGDAAAGLLPGDRAGRPGAAPGA